MITNGQMVCAVPNSSGLLCDYVVLIDTMVHVMKEYIHALKYVTEQCNLIVIIDKLNNVMMSYNKVIM